MHFPRIVLVAIGTAIILPSALAQQRCPQGQREHKDDKGAVWCIDSEGRSYKAEVSLPAKPNVPSIMTTVGSALKPSDFMRLCIPILCVNMMRRGDHYDSTNDDGVLDSEGRVVRWENGSIVVTGRTLVPNSDGNIATGTFTGTISASGDSASGDDVWQAGQTGGTFPFKLTWESDSVWNQATGSGSCNNKKSPQGNLQGEHSTDSSYHLARTSLGLKDYASASCWAHLAEKQGDSRSSMVLGVVYSNPDYDGYNPPRAFQYLKQSADNGDPRGEYLVSLAYRNGIGTRRSDGDASAWRTRAMATDEGRALAATEQQETAVVRPQQLQINPWLVLFGLVVGAAVMDGNGPSVSQGECDRLMSGNGASIGQAHTYGCKHSWEH